jgi:PAS domain S-box-containing protein
MRAHDDPVVETPDFLLAALERANEAVVIVDRDLRVTHFNAAAELIWQLDRAEAIGCHVSHLGLKDLAVARSASDQRRGSEIAIQRKDGSRILAALSLSPVEIDGQSRTIAFVRDITAEVDQRERLALLTLVANRTNRAVVVTDHDLRIVYANAAFGGMFGYSPEEAQGGRRASCLWVAIPTAGPWQGCDAGSARKVAARRKSSLTTRMPRAAAVQRSASSSMVD